MSKHYWMSAAIWGARLISRFQGTVNNAEEISEAPFLHKLFSGVSAKRPYNSSSFQILITFLELLHVVKAE